MLDHPRKSLDFFDLKREKSGSDYKQDDERFPRDTRNAYLRWKAENEVKEESYLEHQKSNITVEDVQRPSVPSTQGGEISVQKAISSNFIIKKKGA